INGEIFDGEKKTAIFPGDLPKNPDSLFEALESIPEGDAPPLLNFVRFRPPHIEETGGGLKLSVPHIRLDRALQYLIGDRLARPTARASPPTSRLPQTPRPRTPPAPRATRTPPTTCTTHLPT